MLLGHGSRSIAQSPRTPRVHGDGEVMGREQMVRIQRLEEAVRKLMRVEVVRRLMQVEEVGCA